MLSISGLNVSYGSIHAVRDLSLEVPAGAIVTLVGGNGAGKTSTLRAISGLLPRRGSIRLQGEEIAGLKPHEIVAKGLCQVPEGRMIFSNLTVRENLEMGAWLDKDDKRKARNLERVMTLFPRLKERRVQQAGTLSGGEQQMLAIGRALMGNPRFLMLDEPSLGIAPRLVGTIFRTIVEINKQDHIPILLVEQNARLALEISDRAYVLESGRIVMQGASEELAKNPALRAAYLGA